MCSDAVRTHFLMISLLLIYIYICLLSLRGQDQRKNCTVTVYSILQQVCCMENTASTVIGQYSTVGSTEESRI